jgi:hypothetical protein
MGPRTSQRAFTFLEAILASLLLAGAGATIITALGAIERMTSSQQDRLNAAEVAHQIILQYLHDPSQLPDASLPIEQGKHRYLYLLREDVLIEEGRSQRITVRDPRAAQSLSENERLGAGLVMITVNVHRDTGGAVSAGGPALVSISRVFDPYASTDDSTLIRHVERLWGRRLEVAPR